MSDNETYNGWTNRETWAFMLHVNNEQGLYESVKEWAQGWIEAQNDCGDSSLGDYVVETVQGYLEEILEECHAFGAYRILAEVGSWWRIDRAEVGAAVRESLED